MEGNRECTMVVDNEAETSFPSRPRKKKLYKSLLQQMEFYFSDANLRKDRFLSKLVQEDSYVDLSVFLRFNRIRSLTHSLEDISKSLRNSQFLQLSDDGIRVQRIGPIKEKENEDECTVYVEQLPIDANHDWLKNIFSRFGKVEYISIPKYTNSGKIKGFAFVEFDHPDSAKQALEAFRSIGCCLPMSTAPENLCSIATFSEDQNFAEDTKGSFSQINDFNDEITKNDENDNKNERVNKMKRKRRASEEESGCHVENKETESERIIKKKKDSEIENDTVEELSDSQRDNLKPKKKRKTHSTESEFSNAKRDEDENGSSLNNKDYDENISLKKKKKKKAKRESSEQTNVENVEEQAVVDCKESVQEDENLNTEEHEIPLKKNRTRKKKKKEKLDLEYLGLKILPKKEWKKLRNKYLDLQKSKMKNLKQHLQRARWGQYYHQEHHYQSQKNDSDKKDIGKIPFVPSVIVKVNFQDSHTDIAKFKTEARSHADVKFVDAGVGQNVAYIRCSNEEFAKSLVSKQIWGTMEVLEGQEEKNYWVKVNEDRIAKFQSKKSVTRGRDKLLKRAEKVLGKQIRFDEGK